MSSFKNDKDYIFDKYKYIEDEKLDKTIDAKNMYEFNLAIKNWVDKTHGEKIKVLSESLGVVQAYSDIPISANWCIEIEKEY